MKIILPALTHPMASLVLCFVCCSTGCTGKKEGAARNQVAMEPPSKTKVIFDTDANNELDDQHALAYLVLNGGVFNVRGVTVNATSNGGNIQGHYEEAVRVLQLCNMKDAIRVYKGADKNFDAISAGFDPASFDGEEAVNFLLESTKKDSVVIVAVGKLTNIALALKKDPGFASRTKIIWLGSNYPEPGEYNQDNDTIAMNYILNSTIPFEMVTVRYGKPSGTAAVSVSLDEIHRKMPGLGPIARDPVKGRHGGEFRNFGDYSVSLFDHIFDHIHQQEGEASRPLFDMVAVAILKNKDWGQKKELPAPVLIDNHWVDRPGNGRKISIWENFDKEQILTDFYNTLQYAPLVTNQGN